MALKYKMKKRARKMAEGGAVPDSIAQAEMIGKEMPEDDDAFMGIEPSDVTGGYAEGGVIQPSGEDAQLMGMVQKYLGGKKDEKKKDDGSEAEGDELAMAHGGPVCKACGGKMYSEGGEVANDVGDGADADVKENQFDDLVLRDDLSEHYTGKNSGDEIGDAQEDEDQRDMVAQIMKSRKKKDRLPQPA
jgi:hypothetical protein